MALEIQGFAWDRIKNMSFLSSALCQLYDIGSTIGLYINGEMYIYTQLHVTSTLWYWFHNWFIYQWWNVYVYPAACHLNFTSILWHYICIFCIKVFMIMTGFFVITQWFNCVWFRFSSWIVNVTQLHVTWFDFFFQFINWLSHFFAVL